MKKGLKLIGVLGLASVLFYACDQKTTDSQPTASSSAAKASGDFNIAYVLTDSVINKYDYFKLKSEELQKKGEKFDADLQSRAQGFEREVANFEQSARNMTQNQALAKQEELGKKQQNLMTYRNNLMSELSTDEANLYNEVYEKVQEYLKGYAEQEGLDLILSYTRGGAVWYGVDALDVTESVIDGLNKSYNQTAADSAK